MNIKPLAIASALLFAGTTFAQQTQQQMAKPEEVKELISQLEALQVQLKSSAADLNKQIGAPGTAFAHPQAYGASAGTGFIGVSGLYDQDGKGRVNGNGRLDGSMVAGVGFGDSQRTVGVEVSANITSTNPKDGSFGDSGMVGIKLHRVLDARNGTAVAMAFTDVGRWGDVKKSHRTNYAALSTNTPLQLVGNYPVSLTVGAGSGGYSPLSSAKLGQSKTGGFIGLGSQLSQRTSVSISQVGSLTNIGMGLVPFNLPISLSVGFTDVTNKSTAGRAFVVNAGYAFTY
jgi:hypothetical protein